MASRSLYFFMRFHEVETLAWKVVEKYGMYLVLLRPVRRPDRKRLYYNSEYALIEGSIMMSDNEMPRRIWFSPKRENLDELDFSASTGYNPAKLGWARCEVPQEENEILYKSWIDAKSDWLDRNDMKTYDNPVALDTFKKVSSVFRKELKRPVWLGGRAYRDVGYSKGAEDWLREGGFLKQGPTDKSVYLIDPPEETTSEKNE